MWRRPPLPSSSPTSRTASPARSGTSSPAGSPAPWSELGAMSIDPTVLAALAAMGIVTYLTRAGGFWLMGFIALTPRIEAGLRTIPSSVMVALMTPLVLNAGPAEAVGYTAVLIVMLTAKSDVFAAMAGVAGVALTRALMSGTLS
ncbi:MAG: AzlD domain-containing protein [Alphaproteobacteria bacterium]|nr:AzlD domain-containing protein [Alphaproteobacteria bacterium]